MNPASPVPDEEPRILIAAFNGWSDAGNAATSALAHLEEHLDLEVVHQIGSDDYVDLQMYRPMLSKQPDGTRVIEWPHAKLHAPILRSSSLLPAPDTDADSEPEPAVEPTPRATTLQGMPVTNLFLFAATEPAHHWVSFSNEVLELVDDWDIDLVVFLGSMFSDAPHSRPISVSLTSDDPEIRSEFEGEESNYEGPVGISTVINQLLTHDGVPSVSLWAQVPHYVHSAPSPKATLALLDRCELLLDIVIPRGDLLREATEWESNINLLANQDDDMSRYIERLEEARDSVEGPESTGEAIAHEFEKFLQIRPDQTDTPDQNNDQSNNEDPDTEL